MSEEKFHCACGQNLKCKGDCRDENLFREDRKFLRLCPSAYNNRHQEQRPKREVSLRTQVPELELLKSSLSISRTCQ
jgi:hypothetical protein